MAWNPLSFEFKTLKSHDCTGARRTNSLLQFKTDFLTKLDENRFVPAGHLSRQQCAQSETPEISYKKLKYIGIFSNSLNNIKYILFWVKV